MNRIYTVYNVFIHFFSSLNRYFKNISNIYKILHFFPENNAKFPLVVSDFWTSPFLQAPLFSFSECDLLRLLNVFFYLSRSRWMWSLIGYGVGTAAEAIIPRSATITLSCVQWGEISEPLKDTTLLCHIHACCFFFSQASCLKAPLYNWCVFAGTGWAQTAGYKLLSTTCSSTPPPPRWPPSISPSFALCHTCTLYLSCISPPSCSRFISLREDKRLKITLVILRRTGWFVAACLGLKKRR